MTSGTVGMNKATLVVCLCSIVIISGFIASVYLMTTVNPEPLPKTKESELNEPVLESIQEASAHLVEAAPYGLETDFYTSKRPGLYPNSGRKIMPPIWPRRKHDRIMPPIWPTTSVSTSTDVTRSTKPDQYEASTTEEILSSNKSDVKSRKSRSDYISHEDLGSIILKILNISSTGNPTIEIKLHPKGCLKKKNAKGNKHAKNKPILIAKLENNDYIDNNSQIVNHTVINVCGNDSVVIDEDVDILELIELVKSISSEDKKNKITNKTNENMTTVLLNKHVLNKGLVYNTIEPFNINTENNSNINFNVCNINDTSTIGPMKGNINNVAVTHSDNINNTKIFDAVKNSSEIDTKVNIEMNNKESNIIVFHEEEIDSITQKTTHAPDHVTILINDIIQSNISDLYIENDSDIIY